MILQTHAIVSWYVLVNPPKVRLQCVETPGRIVVPMGRAQVDSPEAAAVLEFHTVALHGEILLQAEGM